MLHEEIRPVDNRPNFAPERPDFDTYRLFVDGLIPANDDGLKPMPRTGVFDKEDYDKLVRDPATVFRSDGMPLIAPYPSAYPNANLEQYPELRGYGYLMLPLDSITDEDRELITASGFRNLVGEIVIPEVIDYGQPWEEVAKELVTVKQTIENAVRDRGENVGWAKAAPFDGDGRPVIHHLMNVTPPERVADDGSESGLIDTINTQEEVLDRIGDLAQHHVDAFSEHSKTATLFTLDHAAEVRDMLASPDWYVAAHLDANGTIDCAALVTLEPDQAPWLDPSSIGGDSMFSYTDSVSTSAAARREGIATQVLTHAFIQNGALAKQRGYSSINVPFDTAGDSTDVVPHLAKAIFDITGSKIIGGRIDVLAHLELRLDG